MKDAENFVDQLKSEGEHVNSNVTSAAVVKGGPISNNKIPSSTIATEPYVLNLAFENYLDNLLIFSRYLSVQLRIEEKISLSCGRDGGLHNMEVHGLLTLFITDESYGRVRVQVSCKNQRKLLFVLNVSVSIGRKSRLAWNSNSDASQCGQGIVPHQTVYSVEECY